MKKIVFMSVITISLLCAVVAAAAEKPLLGVGGISANSPRALRLSLLFEERLLTVIEQTARFTLVNTRLLKSELIKFNCLEEKCMLRFAADSGMGLFIAGDIDDRGDEIIMNISAYGMDFPFNGKRFYRYTVSIPVSKALAEREYSYIFEEHALRFASGCLMSYRHPSAFVISGDLLTVNGIAAPDGKYTVYRKIDGVSGAPAVGREAGHIDVKKGKIVALTYINPVDGDFVLVDNKDEAFSLERSFYAKKHEQTFTKLTWDEKLYMALFIPFGSAVMPVVSPFLGYFSSADWPGLALWSANALPYISLEIAGFVKRPSTYRDDKRDIPKSSKANYYFAWYMLFSGGGSLFVDAFASQYLKNASMYMGGQQPYMGSDFITGYLALTTPGGGHFYKGYRGWGYAYFHASNLLVYGMLWQFSASERRHDDGTYHKGKTSKKTGYVLASFLGALKLTEFVHAFCLPYRIKNGTEIADGDSFNITPVLFACENSAMSLGLRFSLQF